MEAMVSMVETRDPETGEHIVRTQLYAKAVAEHLRKKGFFPDILSNRFIQTLYLSVPLHDIGKVGIPDNILLKPGRLTGKAIPLAGRIMAISDVYDALINKRCYKPPFSHEKAMEIIHEENGKLFDPVIVKAFLEIEPEIKEIAARFKDE